MQVAIVADAHLISPEDPNEGRRSARQEFVDAWPSFQRVISHLNERGVDEVIFTGDLVDYYSPENRDFALGLLADLEMPWHLIPGNHDFQVVTETDDETVVSTDRSTALAGWRTAGVSLDNRVREVDGVRFLLMESALSDVPDGTEDWLAAQLDSDRPCLLCTHVPIDQPEVVRAITDREPQRNLDKYVQRGVPGLYTRSLADRVDAIFSGHLHFATQATVETTRQHVLPLSIRRQTPQYPLEGSIIIVDTDSPGTYRRVRPMSAAE